jgi:hypothetical protein
MCNSVTSLHRFAVLSLMAPRRSRGAVTVAMLTAAELFEAHAVSAHIDRHPS